jgi:hypothetical protein
MANSFNTQENVAGKIAATALGLLKPDMVLSRTINRDYENEFGGGVGNVVNVKRPLALTANTRAYGATSAITVSTITEPAVQPVTITHQVYSAVSVTDEDLNMELEDFGRQVLLPQTTAVAFQIEQAVAEEMSSLALTSGIVAGDIPSTFVNARKYLRDLGLPTDGLTAAVGTGAAAELLKTDLFRRADASGSNDALINASLGRLSGFNIVESNLLSEFDIVFYHRDAFTLAVRAPRVPEGVTFGQSVAADGFALRYIRDYDPAVLADRSIVNTFIGTQTMSMTKQTDGSAAVPAIRVNLD